MTNLQYPTPHFVFLRPLRAGRLWILPPQPLLDGEEFFSSSVMMQRQNRATDMAIDRSHLPPEAHGVGIYSSHPNDNNGFTWQGNDALIAQDDALRAAVA